jgi:hypothetical protein
MKVKKTHCAKVAIFAHMLRPLFLLAMLALTFETSAQYQWDFGVNIGASNYLGDIGGAEQTRRDFIYDMKLNRTQYTFGGFARYKVSTAFSVNVGLNHGRIRGNDFNSLNPARVARNLSFRNNITELSARGEFTLFYSNDAGGRGYYNPDFKMYGFVGAGVIRHNPRTRYYGPLEEFDGQLVALQPLRTEGVDYSLWQFVVPGGIGLYFTYSKVHRIGWELGYRFTFTDYLDDISRSYAPAGSLSQTNKQLALELSNRTHPETLDRARELALKQGVDVPNAASFAPGEKRGDPTNNDGFLFTQLSYSYAMKGKSNFSKSRYGYMKKKNRARRKTRAKF